MPEEKLKPEGKRLNKIAQLKAKLQKEENLLSKEKRKERDGQLIAFGIYLEERFKDANVNTKMQLEENINKYLTGRNLERALAGISRLKAQESSASNTVTA